MALKGPFLWLGTPIRGQPKPWEVFPWVQGLLVNAYEILTKSSLDKEIRRVGVHNILGFKGHIMMDSGGFQFMRRSILDVDPLMILGLYHESKPNYGVILDHPIAPGLQSFYRRQRQFLTLKNTQEMVKHHKGMNPILIPVIHGYSIQSVQWYLEKLRRIYDFPILGIGSLVPSMFKTKGALKTHLALRLLSYIRKTLPGKILHTFGIASTLSMHLMFYAGIDSVDSSAWRLKAAYGAIQLPGVGDRYISTRKRHKKYRDLSREEMRILEECRCPICRKGGVDILRASFSARALHNAWVYQRETLLAQKLIESCEYEQYVESILAKNPYFVNLFELVRKAAH